MSAISRVRKARTPQQLNTKWQFEYVYQKLQSHIVVHYAVLQTVIIMLCVFRNVFGFPDILKMTEYANVNGIVCPHEKLICRSRHKNYSTDT